MSETEIIAIDHVHVESDGEWFAVYRQGEGFQPWVLAVCTDSATSAEEAWLSHPRQREQFADADAFDTEDIVVRRIDIAGIPKP